MAADKGYYDCTELVVSRHEHSHSRSRPAEAAHGLRAASHRAETAFRWLFSRELKTRSLPVIWPEGCISTGSYDEAE
jgi:hypothetical protein